MSLKSLSEQDSFANGLGAIGAIGQTGVSIYDAYQKNKERKRQLKVSKQTQANLDQALLNIYGKK